MMMLNYRWSQHQARILELDVRRGFRHMMDGTGDLLKAGVQAGLGLAPMKRSALRTYLN